MTRRVIGLAAVVGLLAAAAAGRACSYCDGNVTLSPTFRQEAALSTARVILHGTIAKSRLSPDGRGVSEFAVKTVLRSDPAVKDKKTLQVPRYLPLAAGETQDWLIFCDVDGSKVDPYRGVRIKGPATVAYVKKALAMGSKDPVANLAFYFGHLEDPDPEVSRDAFLEFAKASDASLALAAPRLSADKLRGWIKDPKTPAARLGVYALLLGAGKKAEADAAFLRGLLDSKEDRYKAAADGLLGGYIACKPKDGWALALGLLADGRKPLPLRLAVLRTLRFYQGAQPKESRPHLLQAMRTLLTQGELADLAMEDLRRWKMWDLSAEVVRLYGQKGFDAPLMKRAILRYALSCQPTDKVKDFLRQRRGTEPGLVKEVEEGLQYEKAG
jgi:hypothetical protein